MILSVELSCHALERVHRRERAVPQVDPQLGERVVARVQVEALVGSESLEAHPGRQARNPHENIRVVLVRPHQSTLIVNVFSCCFVTIAR